MATAEEISGDAVIKTGSRFTLKTKDFALFPDPSGGPGSTKRTCNIYLF